MALTAPATDTAFGIAAAAPKQHCRTPPAVPLAVANISRSQANNLRAEWLIGLATDLLTVLDLLAHATTPDGRPLRRISLLQLLTAQVGCGQVRAMATLHQLRALLRCSTPYTAMTIGWLLDNRTSGRRLLAFATAMQGGANCPWAGWPLIDPAD